MTLRGPSRLAPRSGPISQRIKESVSSTPVLITAVNIENFSFTPEYEANINDRMAAQVAAIKAERTAKKTVIEAQALADSQLAVATANAKAMQSQGEAEAAAIRAKGAALRGNPALIDLTAAEKWNGTLPATMVPRRRQYLS